MKHQVLLVAVAVACATFAGESRNFVAAPRLSGAGADAETRQQLDPNTVRRQFMGAVAEMNAEEKTILVEDRSLGFQKLQVDNQTRFHQGDKSASWNELRLGAMVDGVCVGAPGNAYAEIINIGR
jgi:hypothetical protein